MLLDILYNHENSVNRKCLDIPLADRCGGGIGLTTAQLQWNTLGNAYLYMAAEISGTQQMEDCCNGRWYTSGKMDRNEQRLSY